MSTQTGTINVQTENIFPIIKKFLYSDHEIFLRELVANAVDATQKLRTLSSRGEIAGELGDTNIEIILDEKAKTLTIKDRGIGMTTEEVDKYINQIAFSSAQEFLDKYQDDAKIIGHFGLGFYSGFMVADKMEVRTLSWKDGATATSWTCDGSPEYQMDSIEKTDRGTEIILHIADDSTEFLGKARIDELLDKYCKFLPVAIKFGENEREEGEGDDKTTIVEDNIINNPTPAWTKSPCELSDEDYASFYNELYPYSQPPLFHIHLNVDYPFNLTGVLYFPKVDNTFEVRKNKIQLYCNQVFVTDEVAEIVPEWLTLLHGVIDSPDIPLNVSRSYLQSDQNVKKINSYISKKVAERLEKLYKDDRKDYETKWEHINVFAKYGMMSDEKFYDRAKKFCLFENLDGTFFTEEELKEKLAKNQTDKNGNLVLLYTNNEDDQYTYIEAAKQKDFEVLRLNSVIDAHFISEMERKMDKVTFKRVDADTADKLVEKEEEAATSLLTSKEEEDLKATFTEIIGEKSGLVVELKALSTDDQPVMLVKPEFARRMEEMQQYNNMGMGQMPEFNNLIVNTNHPLAQKVLSTEDATEKQRIVKQLHDVALLSQGKLKGKALAEFINRSVELI